jgi:hypothetical protein
MNEIKEAYVSFEVAKLLKEKGFNEPCLSYFWGEENNKEISYTDFQFTNKQLYSDQILRPTHQMACAWLREEHHIFIEIGTSVDLNGNYHFGYTILDNKCKYLTRGYTDFNFNYEDAVEAALEYTVKNLI